jgi:hypothetical protein
MYEFRGNEWASEFEELSTADPRAIAAVECRNAGAIIINAGLRRPHLPLPIGNPQHSLRPATWVEAAVFPIKKDRGRRSFPPADIVGR